MALLKLEKYLSELLLIWHHKNKTLNTKSRTILWRSASICEHLLTVTLIYGWELGGMLASSGTALAAEFFGTMTAAIYPDASRSTLRS